MNGLHVNTEERGLKDPWSAITHFIGMLMAMLAAVPLLIKNTFCSSWDICFEYDTALRSKRDISFNQGLAKSSDYSEKD